MGYEKGPVSGLWYMEMQIRAHEMTLRKLKNFWSKKYGCGLGRFTHRAGNILHSSTKSTGSQVDDHAVRYHATHDNKYLAYFKGHTAR